MMMKDMQGQINELQEKQSADISVATPSTPKAQQNTPRIVADEL